MTVKTPTATSQAKWTQIEARVDALMKRIDGGRKKRYRLATDQLSGSSYHNPRARIKAELEKRGYALRNHPAQSGKSVKSAKGSRVGQQRALLDVWAEYVGDDAVRKQRESRRRAENKQR